MKTMTYFISFFNFTLYRHNIATKKLKFKKNFKFKKKKSRKGPPFENSRYSGEVHLLFYSGLGPLIRWKLNDFMGALCLTVPIFLFRVIFIPAYTNPDKKAHRIKMALMVPKLDSGLTPA